MSQMSQLHAETAMERADDNALAASYHHDQHETAREIIEAMRDGAVYGPSEADAQWWADQNGTNHVSEVGTRFGR